MQKSVRANRGLPKVWWRSCIDISNNLTEVALLRNIKEWLDSEKAPKSEIHGPQTGFWEVSFRVEVALQSRDGAHQGWSRTPRYIWRHASYSFYVTPETLKKLKVAGVVTRRLRGPEWASLTVRMCWNPKKSGFTGGH
jgi:hypothetical protein